MLHTMLHIILDFTKIKRLRVAMKLYYHKCIHDSTLHLSLCTYSFTCNLNFPNVSVDYNDYMYYFDENSGLYLVCLFV